MYFLTLIYFVIMFGVPVLFINGECGDGVETWVLILYATQAVMTLIYEVVAVKGIERRLQKKQFFEFNRWHFIEAIMGQIARFDTFLDTCFMVLLIQCDLWNLVYPVCVFIFFYLLYPVT